MSNNIVIPISSSGHCPKLLSAELLHLGKAETPEYLKLAAEEGNLHEDAIKRKLRSEGYVIKENHGEECEICKSRYGLGRNGIHVEIIKDGIELIGHLDGLIIGKFNGSNEAESIIPGTKESILECKSMSLNMFNRWTNGNFDEFYGYASQLTCYMEATKLNTALYIVKNRNSGFTERKIIIGSPLKFEDIWNRLLYVTTCVRQNKLAESVYNPESIECYYCNIVKDCIKEIAINPIAQTEFIEALKTREITEDSIKELDKTVKSSERKIKDFLIGLNLSKIRVDGYSVSFSQNNTRVTYSKDSLIYAGVTEDQLKLAENRSLPFDKLYIRNLNSKRENNSDS